jgi:hypothetical protein
VVLREPTFSARQGITPRFEWARRAPPYQTFTHGPQRVSVANATPFEGDLSTYLTLRNGRYFVAQLLGPGDAFRKPLLPQLYEPVLTSLGNSVLVLRGFEREGGAATVQEWRCEILSGRPA